MRPSRELEKLRDAACYRLRRLRETVLNVVSMAMSREREFILSFVVIETLNSWSNFSRSYYLSCILTPRTVTGKRITVPTPIPNFNSAIGLAVTHSRPNMTPPASGVWHRRDEPPWHDHNLLMRFCGNITCSNIIDIQAAFSFGSRVFIDLPVFRNFFAHRNGQTCKAAADLGPQYGIPATLRPSQILLSRALGRPQPLILDQFDDLITTIELLCD
jgi:hypothetical protein